MKNNQFINNLKQTKFMGTPNYGQKSENTPAVEQSRFAIVGSYKNEKEFGSDPSGYYVEFDGKQVVAYGSDADADGYAKCVGFVDGYRLAANISPFPEFAYVERADFN